MLLDASFENMLMIAAEADAGAAYADTESCAAAARAIWESPGTWERMSQAALRVARSMNSEAYEPVLESLYRDLAGS